MPNEFKGREPGTSVYYSLEQTERYKSQWMRYQGAQKLLKNRDLIFDNGQIRRFRSKRSPVGYWEVSIIDKATVVLIKLRGVETPTPVTIGEDTRNIKPIYIVMEIRFPISTKLSLYKLSLTGSPEFDPNNPVNPSTFNQDVIMMNILNASEYKNIHDIEINTAYISESPYEKDWDYGKDSFRSSLVTFYNYYDKNSTASYGVAVNGSFIPSTMAETKFPILPIIQTSWGTSGIGELAEARTWTNAFVDFSFQFNGKPAKQCTCPDWQKKAETLPQSPYFSEHVDRDWTESRAGAPDPPHECKHMIAAALLEKNYQPPIDVRAKLTKTEVKNLRGNAKPLKANSQIKPIKLTEQKPPTVKPRKQKDLIPVTDSVDLGQEIWTGEKKTGVYKGSQCDIDLGEDIDTLPEYEEYLIDQKNRENIDNSINP